MASAAIPEIKQLLSSLHREPELCVSRLASVAPDFKAWLQRRMLRLLPGIKSATSLDIPAPRAGSVPMASLLLLPSILLHFSAVGNLLPINENFSTHVLQPSTFCVCGLLEFYL